MSYNNTLGEKIIAQCGVFGLVNIIPAAIATISSAFFVTVNSVPLLVCGTWLTASAIMMATCLEYAL